MNYLTNYKNIKAWPFVEAIKIIKKSENLNSNRAIHFETGYGPSGIPHIGTFAEVLRTNMVRNALREIKKLNSKLQFDQLNVFPQNLKNIFEIQKKENFFKVSKISESIINNKQVDLSNFQEIKKISLNTNLVKSVNFETGKLKKNNSGLRKIY